MKAYKQDEAYRVLQKDAVMAKIIRTTGKLQQVKQQDVYFSLLRSITSQQLSTKAADTIFNRFLDIFPGRDPSPVRVIKLDIEKLRAAGLSYSKANYLKNIALFSKSHGLDYTVLNRMDDEQLIGYLTEIKGVGRWTAEMILMFTMNRPDILPVDDLGIQKAMKHHYKFKSEGKQMIARMLKIAEAWKPYRTLASMHLWKYKDTV